jgi:hypothetical protein
MGHVAEMVRTTSTKMVAVQEAEGYLLELIGLVEQGLVPIVEPPQKRVFG